MSEFLFLKIRLRNGTIKDCQVELSGGPPWKLRLCDDNPLIDSEFERPDLFECLVALRRELEKINALALCAGARPDVFPSGMSRGMGGGRKAYVTKLGHPAVLTDLVDIFDYADAENVGSVAEQMAFRQKWSDSFRYA